MHSHSKKKQNLEKEQSKPQESKRKEIKMKAEINKVENTLMVYQE